MTSVLPRPVRDNRDTVIKTREQHPRNDGQRARESDAEIGDVTSPN